MRQVDKHVDSRVVRHTLFGQRKSGSNLRGKRLTLLGNVFKLDNRKCFIRRDALNRHSAKAHHGDAKENAAGHWSIFHGCGLRIEYRKSCPKHGAVPPENILKGYPFQPDQYVLLSEAELAEIQPADEKTIHLEHFVDPTMVHLVFLAGRSLYLAPANPAAGRPFAAIYRALERSGKWALGRVVFSSRWPIVLVCPENRVLLVHTLYHPAQRRALARIDGNDAELSLEGVRL